MAAGRARRARQQHGASTVRREGRQLHDLVEARVRALVLQHVAAAQRLGSLLAQLGVHRLVLRLQCAQHGAQLVRTEARRLLHARRPVLLGGGGGAGCAPTPAAAAQHG